MGDGQKDVRTSSIGHNDTIEWLPPGQHGQVRGPFVRTKSP